MTGPYDDAEICEGEFADDPHETPEDFHAPGETISYDEIGSLLDEAAVRDKREVSEDEIHVWYDDLNRARVTYEIAREALSWYYTEVYPKLPHNQRFRATTATVIERNNKIRSDRHAAAKFVYEPVPGETVAEEHQRWLAQKRAIGDGAAPPPPRAIDHAGQNRLKELIAGSGIGLLPKDVAAAQQEDLARKPREIREALAARRNPARTVRCPHCRAQPNEPCRNDKGRPLDNGRRVHRSRTETYATSSFECPTCKAAPGTACTESPGSNAPYHYGTHALRIEDSAPPTQEAA